MALNNAESFPSIPESIDPDVIGTIVHRFSSDRGTVNAARLHPDYMATVFKVAAKLYPNDKDKRDAFVTGTELVRALERQQVAAAEIRELVFGHSSADDVDALDQLPASA